jgi:hypothetical protein
MLNHVPAVGPHVYGDDLDNSQEACMPTNMADTHTIARTVAAEVAAQLPAVLASMVRAEIRRQLHPIVEQQIAQQIRAGGYSA